ncbi:hypothetical protein D3C78_705210 [compost metagenome]
MRRAGRWRVALADHRAVADDRGGRAVAGAVEGQVAVEPAAQAEKGVAQRLGDVEFDRGGAVRVGHHGGAQRDGLRDARQGHGEGRRAGQGLAVADLVAHHQFAFAEEVHAVGEEVRYRHVQPVIQGVAHADAGMADVHLQGRRLQQGDGFGDEAGVLAGGGEVDAGLGRYHVARVQRHPLAAGGGRVDGDGDRRAGDRIENLLASGIGIRHVELHQGVGRPGECGVRDGELADEHVVGGDQQGDLGGVGDHLPVGEGNGRQHTAGAGGDRGDLDIARQRLGDRHVGQGLPVRRSDGGGQGAAVVRPGGGFALGGVDRLGRGDHRRVDDETVGDGLDQAGVLGRIVERIVTELEAAADLDGQVRRTVGEAGVGQVAQACGDLHGDHRLVLGHAGEGQFDHHHLVAGAHAEVGGIDHQGIAAGVLGQRVDGLAVGIEGDHVADQVLPQVVGRNEADAVVAVLAGGGHEQGDEGREAGLGRDVGEVHGEAELVAQQHFRLGGGQRRGRPGVGQQAVEGGEGFGAEGDVAVDQAAADFQIPVAAGCSGAGVVAGGTDIRAGELRQLLDQRAARRAGTDVAAVELDVRTGIQRGAPAVEDIGDLIEVGRGQGAVAQRELPGSAVGEDLDRVDLAQLGEGGGDGRQPVLGGIDHHRLDVGGQVGGELLAVLHAAVEHQQVARGRWGRGGFGG